MTTRSSSRRVAAGAATGAILLSLAYGGAAVADDLAPASDPAPASSESSAPTDAPTTETPAVPAPAEPAAPVEQAPDAAPAAAADTGANAEPAEPEEPTEPEQPAEPADPTEPEEPAEEPDTVAPAIIVEMPAPAPRGWYTEAVDIQLTAGDAESGIDSILWQVDGGPVQAVAGDIGTATIEFGGDHEFTAWALDLAGNSSEVATRSVKIDMAPPSIDSFSQPQDAVFQLGQQVQLDFTCSDDLSGVEMCITGNLPNGELDTSTVGDHVVNVIAVDVAGNQTVIPYRYSVTDADTTAPAVTATASGTHVNDEWFTSDDVRVTISLAEPDAEAGTVIVYQAFGQVPRSVEGPSVELELPSYDGIFDIVYYAEDAAGNRSEEQTLRVRRDSDAPDIAYAAHYLDGTPVENGAVVAQNAQIVFGHECSDSVSGVAECFSEVQNGQFLDTKDLGGHSVLLMSTDAAGNEVSVIFDYSVEVTGEPTDPGNGGEEPTDPDTGGVPTQPAPTQPAPAVVTPARSSTGDEERLASTGVSQAAGIAGLVAALLAGGSGLTALGVARRRRAG